MSTTYIPLETSVSAGTSIQEYVKKSNEAKREERSKQREIMGEKITEWFNQTIQSIETDLPKWDQAIRKIKETVSSEHNQVYRFVLEQQHIGKLMDTSTNLITRDDIDHILQIKEYRLSKTISKPNHPLNGCRVYLIMPLKGNQIDIKVDTSDTSCCVLL